MKNTKKFLELVSKKDSGWLAKAQWREDNEDWLDISFSIAVKILSALSANKKAENSLPKNQKELAEVMGCSAQYVNKLLRGEENLQIETICKIQRILGIKLIEVPKAELEPIKKDKSVRGVRRYNLDLRKREKNYFDFIILELSENELKTSKTVAKSSNFHSYSYKIDSFAATKKSKDEFHFEYV